MRGALLAAALMLPAPAGAACKLALVLGLDVSSSVDAEEYRLQIGGLAHAFRTEEVQDAILQPRGFGIAVHVFEWSSRYHQTEIAGWTMLDSAAAIDALADRLDAHRRSRADGSTAVGDALEHAVERFASAPDCQRRTVDLSGDGVTNQGPSPSRLAERGALEGITVNGLAVTSAHPGVLYHYRAHVIHGEDAFVQVAGDFEDYPEAIRAKLLREIGTPFVLGASE